MKECDNSKIHISSNFILSISLLRMFDTLLLRPSLHCNTTLLHFILSISLLIMFDTLLLRPSLHCNTLLHFTTQFRRGFRNTRRSAAYTTGAVFIIHFTAIKTFDLMWNGSWLLRATAVCSRSSAYLRYPGVCAKLQDISVVLCDANLLLRLMLYQTLLAKHSCSSVYFGRSIPANISAMLYCTRAACLVRTYRSANC